MKQCEKNACRTFSLKKLSRVCHLNWNITQAVALEVTNINFLIAHFTMIYESIISLHVSLIFGTVCQTMLWMSVL